MLKWAELERLIRLTRQIRQEWMAKHSIPLLHMPPRAAGLRKTIHEKAALMQMRLHLEAELETRGRNALLMPIGGRGASLTQGNAPSLRVLTSQIAESETK
jgi:hypothetical protein